MPSLFLIIACFFWAISFVASKIALESAPPLFIVSARLFISALCFLFWYALKGFKGLEFKKAPWGKLFLLSLFGTTLHYGTQTMGLEYTSASNASLYAITGPLTITLIAAVWLKERITLKKSVGILLAMAGVLVVMGLDVVLQFKIVAFFRGDGLVILSIFMWGVFTVFGKDLTRKMGGLALTAWVTLIGSLCMIPIALFEVTQPGFSFSAIPLQAWGAIIFLGVTCSFLATVLYFLALERIESQKVGVFLYTIPPMTYLFAGLFLHETMGLNLWIGSVLVFTGVWLTEKS